MISMSRRDAVADRLEGGLGGGDRHRQQHDVGARHGQQRRGRRHVDHAQLARALGGGGRLAVADHALDQPGALERQREGAAHQAAADQSELFKHRVHWPQVSRRGRCPAPCRTRTGLRSSCQRGGHVAAARDGRRGRCRSSTPTGPVRAGRDSKRVIDTPLVFSGTSRSCTAPGLFGTETTRLVQSRPEAGGIGQRLRQADDGEAGAVVGVVLDRVRDDVQAELAWRRVRWRCRPRPGCVAARRAPSALLETARRSAFGRCLASQVWHCASACGWASTTSMPSSELLLAQQVVAHQQADFADDVQRRVQEQVERARDHAFGGVLDADHAELRRCPRPWRGTPRRSWRSSIRSMPRRRNTRCAACSQKVPAGPSTATRCGDSSARQADMISRQMAATCWPFSGPRIGCAASCRSPAPRGRGGRRACLRAS